MWLKSVSYAVNKINILDKLRLVRHLQSAAKDSYLHNPGSEPLIQGNLGDVLVKTAHRYPGRVAIRSVHEDLTISYEQLLTQADSLGCVLRAQGLQKGDRLGIWSHNTAAWIVAMVAATRVGLIVVAINPAYTTSEISFCIKKTSMKGLVIPNSLPNRDYYRKLTELMPELQTSKPGSLVSEACPTLTTIVNTGKEKLPGTLSYESLVTYTNTEASKFCNEVKSEDGNIIFLTSGTTGQPKAAYNSHLGVVNNTYFIGKRYMLHEEHNTICVQAPLFHALGNIVTTLAGLNHGATLVLPAPIYNLESNIRALYTEKCTAITGTPTMYVDMLAQIKNRGMDPPSLKTAIAAAAPCGPQLIRDIQKYLNARAVLGLYGLSETTASIFQSLPGDSIDLVAETVGYIQDHVEVKVLDPNGNVVPFGCAGELVTRGYNVMIGYWDDPKKTKETFTPDGWLYTGDQFKISEDGYGRIVGRLKDIIIRGGENIAPKEIEDLLNTHPDIKESQVVGVPDERLGEELCAVLRLREGATVSVEDVRRHCTDRLSKFKIPRLLKIIDDFPKTASGKIQKFKIKDMIESGKL